MLDAILKTMNEISETKMKETFEIPRFFDELEEFDGDTDIPIISIEDPKPTYTYLITRNESLEGDLHPITGVPFEKRQIDLGAGEIIEGVFPEFDSVFDAHIPEDLFQETDYKQFKECNKQLFESIENNPDIKSKFTIEQLEQIKEGMSDGTAPDGYVWHHSYEQGKMQLVDFDTHAYTGHTGGKTVWGGGNERR